MKQKNRCKTKKNQKIAQPRKNLEQKLTGNKQIEAKTIKAKRNRARKLLNQENYKGLFILVSTGVLMYRGI
jgi:hypothetical protein